MRRRRCVNFCPASRVWQLPILPLTDRYSLLKRESPLVPLHDSKLYKIVGPERVVCAAGSGFSPSTLLSKMIFSFLLSSRRAIFFCCFSLRANSFCRFLNVSLAINAPFLAWQLAPDTNTLVQATPASREYCQWPVQYSYPPRRNRGGWCHRPARW